MLPRELIEELVSGYAATRVHILIALADGIDGFPIVLTLPFEIVGQYIIEGISGALPTSARKLLKLRESFGFERWSLHRLSK
jgi:hypothetical protein